MATTESGRKDINGTEKRRMTPFDLATKGGCPPERRPERAPPRPPTKEEVHANNEGMVRLWEWMAERMCGTI